MSTTEGDRPVRRGARWRLTVIGSIVVVVGVWLAITGFVRRTRLVFDTPLADDGVFDAGLIEPDEMSRFRAVADYSTAHGGQALLVLRGQTILFEEYGPDSAADQPHHLYSGTKSFCCALAAAAVADGLLDLDEPAADTLSEWQDDQRKRRITVRQLLQLSSGLQNDFRGLTLDGLKKPEHQRVRDKYRHAVAQPAAYEPGSRFSYGSVHLAAFGELMRRKLDEDPVDYLARRVFEPIGFRYAGWITDAAGHSQLGYGAWTTARHWARYGALLRDQGRWQGRQVLPAEHLAACWQPSSTLPAYGLTLWLNRELPAEIEAAGFPLRRLRDGRSRRFFDGPGQDRLVAAAGFKGQRLYVIPSKDWVVVRFGDGDGTFSDQRLLSLLLRGPRPSPP